MPAADQIAPGLCLFLTDDPDQIDRAALEKEVTLAIYSIDAPIDSEVLKAAASVTVVVKTDEALRLFWTGPEIEKLGGLPLTLVTHQIQSNDLNDLLLERPIHAWLDLPVTTTALLKALRIGKSKSDDATHFIAVVGVSGGVGATSLAISLTDALLHPDDSAVRMRAALLDLDFSKGGCAARLDVTRPVDFEEFLNMPENLDFSFLESASARSRSGMFVLSADQRGLVIDPRAHDFVLSFLDAANTHFDYVVLDIPYYATTWFDEVVQGADMIILVAENNLDSLSNCVRMRSHIDRIRSENKSDLIFVNKVTHPFWRWSGATTLFNEVFPKVGRVIGWNDPVVMDQALKTSQLPREISPRSSFVKSVRSLAQLIDARLRRKGG